MNAPRNQEYYFATLIGQGVKLVDVFYDYSYDEDGFGELDNVSVCTESGLEIDQYLTDDQLSDIDMECETHQVKAHEEAVFNHQLDIGEQRYFDRMAA